MRWFTGVAFGTVLTVLILGSLGGKVYVPLAARAAEPAATQSAPSTATPVPTATPAYDYAVTSPANRSTPTDGPLAISVVSVSTSTADPFAGSFLRCPCLHVVVSVTYGGQPVSGVSVIDPNTTNAFASSWGATDSAGQLTVRRYAARSVGSETTADFERGRIHYFDFGATHQGRSVSTTKRVYVG